MVGHAWHRSLADILLIAATLGGALTGCHADQQSYLDEAKKFHVGWETNSTHITMVATVETTGWIGIGFSPSGGMAGADMVVGWVTSSGAHVFQDRNSDGQGTPHLDSSQDYHLLWAKETDGKTTMAFTRKIGTCDPKDYEITGDTTRVIYAYGDKDPEGSDPVYHNNRRGVRSVALFGQQTFAIPEITTEVEILPSVNISMPNDTTTYWCSVIKFPDIHKKHHMIKWEPIITPGNEGVVHHMILFGCYDKKDRSNYQGSNASFICSSSENMPPVVGECSQLVAVWAIGGEATLFPRNVGFSFDENDQPGYVMLQTHYDNPLRRNDIVDRSGFRIALTTELRQYDAGVFEAGHSMGIKVPPRQQNFRVHAFCADACAPALPEGGINVFAAMLHAHLLGRQIHVRHHRNGSELRPLASDNHYDFNYQDFRPIEPATRVLRGDTLQVTCSMNSTSRQSVTVGGLATDEEMCLAFLLYYPKMEMTVCHTAPAALLSQFINVTEMTGSSFPRHPAENVSWSDPLNGEIAQDLYDTAPAVTLCLKGFHAAPLPGSFSMWTPPAEARKELQPQHPACSKPPASGGAACEQPTRLWAAASAWLGYLALGNFCLFR